MSVALSAIAQGDLDPFRLGIACSAGRSGRPDLVEAHKWFNIAAQRGNRAAALPREEIAGELSPAEMAGALRAAREWIAMH